MKKTYLVKQRTADGQDRLVSVPYKEWKSLLEQNQRLPPLDKHYFIVDRIVDMDELDIMYIEVTLEEYRQWNQKRMAAVRRHDTHHHMRTYSLDAPLGGQEGAPCLGHTIASTYQMEDQVCDLVLMWELRNMLKTQAPWYVELLDAYLKGEKRACTESLARKYGVSTQTARKYKRQFEELIKKFLSGVSF